MIFPIPAREPAFKRALTISGILHAALFAVIIANPHFPKSPPAKGVIHYINLAGGGGGLPGSGGGGGGGETRVGTTPLPKQSLRDLTTVQKLEAQKKAESELRYPVEKPKKTSKKTPDKTAAVSKPDPKAKAAEAGSKTAGGQAGASGGSGGGGSGLTFGPPGSGGGGGFGFGGDPGLSNFPFTWYVDDIQKKIYESWIGSVIQIGTEKVLTTWVYFRIYRDGSISRVEIKQSSGLQAFDMIAQRAIINARFAPLPREYDQEYLGINLTFEFGR